MLRNKPGEGRYPHVEPQLLKDVLLCRIIQRLVIHVTHTVDLDRLAKGWICLIPVGLIVPVIFIRQSIHHGIKGMINLSSCHDIQCLGMQLIADGFFVRTCCCDKEIQRLLSGIAGSLGKDIIELPVRLGMNLVKNQSRNIQAVLRPDLSRQHLIKPGIAIINNPLCSGHDL